MIVAGRMSVVLALSHSAQSSNQKTDTPWTGLDGTSDYSGDNCVGCGTFVLLALAVVAWGYLGKLAEEERTMFVVLVLWGSGQYSLLRLSVEGSGRYV